MARRYQHSQAVRSCRHSPTQALLSHSGLCSKLRLPAFVAQRMYHEDFCGFGEIRACGFCEVASFRPLVRELTQMLAGIRSAAMSAGLSEDEEKMSNLYLMKMSPRRGHHGPALCGALREGQVRFPRVCW